MERLKPINNIHQAIQRQWEGSILQEERTIEGRFEKLQEEIQEVFAPLSEKGVEQMSLEEKRAVAEELVDVIIISLGCIDSLGFDFETMFFKKIERNWEKYNPVLIDELVQSGMSRKEAIKEAKRRWNEQFSRNLP